MKEDKIIEILARICAIAVIIFCVWINYELNVESWDGMQICMGNNLILIDEQ